MIKEIGILKLKNVEIAEAVHIAEAVQYVCYDKE